MINNGFHMNINATRALALLKDYWSFDNDYVERGKAGQRIPGWNWEEKSGDEKEKVSLSGFFRGTFSAFSDERTRRLITTRFS